MPSTVSKHHDDSLYYECLAKIILEKIFKNWSLRISDRPDLQDKINKVGIEVTQVLPDGCNQAISLMKNEKRIEGKLKEQGYGLPLDGLLIHPTKEWERGKPFPTYNYLLNGIQKKIDKIKSYKHNFDEINLYVFTDNLDLDIDTINVLFLKILEMNKEAFNNIFIDASYKIFHLKKEFFGSCFIDRDEYTSYQHDAIKMEEDIKNE